MGSMFRGSCVLSLGIVMAAAGCSEGQNDPGVGEQTGKVQLVVTSSALSAADVYQVRTEISSETWDHSFEYYLTQNGTQWSGTLEEIPVGEDWVFAGFASDWSGQVVYDGSVSPVAILPNQTAFVSLNLDQVAAPIPFTNSAPRIQALTATGIAVQPIDRVIFSVTAADPDSDYLYYTWSADEGSFETNGRIAHWIAPRRQGVYPVTITVDDGRGLTATATIDVTVLTTLQEGNAEVTVNFNTFPEVQQVTADAGRIVVDDTVKLFAAVYEPDGDAVTYTWSSDCEGSFDELNLESTVFTLAALPESAACTFTATISDGRGGENHGSVTIAAEAAPEVEVGEPDSISITQPGEAYGDYYAAYYTCSGWYYYDARTIATWACNIAGYQEAYSYRESTASEFSTVHVLYSNYAGAGTFNWNNGATCNIGVVTDIECL